MRALSSIAFAALLSLVSSSSLAQGQAGTLTIVGAPVGAQVFVDAEPVGVAPIAPLRLAPGRYTVRVTRSGYTEHTQVVTIERGVATPLEVELLPVSMAVRVESEPPGAQAFVDGRFVGETPLEVELLEGRRVLRLVRAGFQDRFETIDSQAGERTTLTLSLTALPSAREGQEEDVPFYESPYTWIAVGAGAALIAVLAIVIVSSSGDDPSRVDQFCLPGCVLVEPDAR